MNEPRRLIEGDAPGAELLSAARAYRPSRAARRRVRRRLGLPLALSLGATLSAALAATSTSTKVLLVAAAVTATTGGGFVAYRAAMQEPAAALQRSPEAKRARAPAALPDPSPTGTVVAQGTTDPSPARAPRERLTPPPARRRAAVARPPAPPPAIAPPVARPPAPPVARPPAPPDPLAAELALLEAAESALRERRFGVALARLQEHRQAFPDSALGEEATVLRIAALFGDDQRARAAAEAERFLTRSGGSLLADRVRSMLSAHPDGPNQPPNGDHP